MAIRTSRPEHIHHMDFLLHFYQCALPRELLVEIFHIAHVIRHDLTREMRETVYELQQADASVSEILRSVLGLIDSVPDLGLAV